MKWYAYLAILKVVAYHIPQMRHTALALIATFWPRALGHVIVGQSLPIIIFASSLKLPSVLFKFFDDKIPD